MSSSSTFSVSSPSDIVICYSLCLFGYQARNLNMSTKDILSGDCLALCRKDERRTAKVVISGIILFNTFVLGIIAVVAIVNSATSSRTQQDHTALNEALDKAYKEVELMNQEQLQESDADASPDLQFLNLLKPVSHFSGLDFDMRTSGRDGLLTAVRNWANPDGSDRKLLYNGMSYENGSITVPAAGVYHITSHVKFYVEDNRKDDKPFQTFQHQVVSYSSSGRRQVVLFENAVTECKEGINDGAHLEYPSDAGGLAQLDAGDQVMVKLSNIHPLKHDRDWHYFDIHLV
ncbi:uncharacterized protein LOC124126656 [Haliotis rufescens]|uniref:uncharacterized protein LOC124126656 n=1 Tax=Haliotis rufescens TaxID=6454 RepID=UPI00201FA1BE|nr:uncharacterized protein LOC124126656 [Haliotis rufescens]